MNVFLNLVLAVQMLTALSMIGLILIQHGKGADMGAAFGTGGSGSLFGASGSANFLSRTTGVLAAVFFVCTLALAYFGNLRPVESGSVLEGTVAPAPMPAPAASGVAAQIPGTTVPPTVTAPAAPATTTTAPVPPAMPASGAAQIPTK